MILIALIAVWAVVLLVAVGACRAAAAGDQQIVKARTEAAGGGALRPFAA
jgi:hypothetical protein